MSVRSIADDLTRAGLPADHATAIARSIVDHRPPELVTTAVLRADLAELETRLTVRLGGLIVAAVGVIVAAIRLL